MATLREALRGRQDVHLAILFGSRARGRARPDSDVDLAVQGEDLDLLALARDAIFVHQGRPGPEDAGSPAP